MRRSSSFVQGAFTLAVAGFGSRFLGAFMRIILASLIGDVGIGLYQMAYPFYSMLLAVSTAGIPVAISKMVSERMTHGDYRGAFQVFRISFFLLTLSGLIISLLFFKGASFFARVILKESQAYLPLVSISPAIFFVTVMSSLRGFFQGQQLMVPTALSQISEQFIRVLVAVALAMLLLPRGIEYAAAGAAFGAVAGAVAGLLVLVVIYLRQRGKFGFHIRRQRRYQAERGWSVLYQIAVFSIPITLGALVMPLVSVADMVVVLRLQAAGFAPERVSALYGQLSGMANSLIHFPTVVTLALSVSLVPAISEAFALKNRKLIVDRTDLAMRLTMYFALPSAVGLILLARPINIFLFDNPEAAYPLRVLAAGIIFLSLYFTTSGILQGLGRTIIPVKNMLYGVIIKFIFTWVLTGIPVLNIGGAAAATILGFALAAFFNIKEVSVLTHWRWRFGAIVIKPALAAAVMTPAVILLYRFSGLMLGSLLGSRSFSAAATILSIIGGALIYGVTLMAVGGVTRKELESVPRFGNLLASLLGKVNLLRR